MSTEEGSVALRVQVRGRVQGVGFRPHAARLAQQTGVSGWVRNGPAGVEIVVEGAAGATEAFVQRLTGEPPPAAVLNQVEITPIPPEGHITFAILRSEDAAALTVPIAPDLATCSACLVELRDPASRFYGYPFLNCTQCGPRYTVVEALPYDRPHTTLAAWPMCGACTAEYADPQDRRYHAQPTACPRCGPGVHLVIDGTTMAEGADAIAQTATLLRDGDIVAVKGLGGYLLACDAQHAEALEALRTRKGRREKPFALMARSLAEARRWVRLTPATEALLTEPARPIVLLPPTKDAVLPDAVAPGRDELGLMLPHAPLHELLFDAGAPPLLVMTSGNRSSEPIAYRDADAMERLAGLADAVLLGERPIAQRVDDSVVRPTMAGPVLLRRARGYAPSAVAQLPRPDPILALGGDLKCAPLLSVDGQAFLAPYVGDLAHHEVEVALRQLLERLLDAYGLRPADVQVVHDAHPGYRSTGLAQELAEAGGRPPVAVQHHRAHIAAVLAERGAWDIPVVGLALDGTGWGDDATVWGGEVFTGSLRAGLDRVDHLRPAWLPGGDAAAQVPVQAAAGFLAEHVDAATLEAAPFGFPPRYRLAARLVERGVRTTATTSAGRLFDAAAALCGFARPTTYEGQAAAWLEAQARRAAPVAPYPCDGLDGHALLMQLLADRQRGRPVPEVARAFHAGLAEALVRVAQRWAEAIRAEAIVASGGVFQNALLIELLHAHPTGLPVWLPQALPPGDGGLALGQAALAC